MAMIYLTEEIRDNILRRLPARSLVRFTCVSKSWYALIRSASFTSTFKRNLYLFSVFLPHVSSRDTPALRLYDETFQTYYQTELPSCKYSNTLEFIGSCNGLICVSVSYSSHGYRETILNFWNPAIRKFKTLPESSPPPQSHYSQKVYYALGFHTKNLDHQLVKFQEIKEDDFYGSKEVEAEVYSLRSDSWKKIGAKSRVEFGWYRNAEAPISVDGSLYWDSYDNETETPVIASFDLVEEVFREILFPESLSDGGYPMVKFGESISLVDYQPRRYDYKYHEHDIWVLHADRDTKEYFWTLQFTISTENWYGDIIGFTREGSALHEMDDDRLCSYDFKTHKVKEVGACAPFVIRFEEFEENFVLFDDGKSDAGGIDRH